jgi:hypothetical protein
MPVIQLYLSIAVFIKRDCVQKSGLLHMDGPVKTVTKVVRTLRWRKAILNCVWKRLSVWRFAHMQDCSLAWSWVCDKWTYRTCQWNKTMVENTPHPELDGAQWLPSPVFSSDLHVKLQGVGSRVYSVSIWSQGSKVSPAFQLALSCHTLNILNTWLCMLLTRL